MKNKSCPRRAESILLVQSFLKYWGRGVFLARFFVFFFGVPACGGPAEKNKNRKTNTHRHTHTRISPTCSNVVTTENQSRGAGVGWGRGHPRAGGGPKNPRILLGSFFPQKNNSKTPPPCPPPLAFVDSRIRQCWPCDTSGLPQGCLLLNSQKDTKTFQKI